MTDSDFKLLLKKLENPECYSPCPDEIEHIQTHISHVFIADPYVYKLKKHVDFGFLDYSTLEKRKKFCKREVSLNRRLTDDIYLGVVGISEGDKYPVFDSEDLDSKAIIEYAVKMRKLPEQYFLHRYIEEGQLRQEHLDRVAETLTTFYRGQREDGSLDKWGKVETIRVNTDENFSQTESFIGQTLDGVIYEAIKYFTNGYLDRNSSLFDRRIAEGRIVDGHGDLHLDHIHITPEKVQIYDCIEFNERFRYGDLAVDLAFLAMDLDFQGCWSEEQYFIRTMSERLDDQSLQQIIDFYKCYRAYVKGKVKSLQSAEEEVSPKDRERSARIARQYFQLSLRYALLGSQPMVVIFMGEVGTGKSTLANLLADKVSIARFASDKIRKKLAGLPLTERTPEHKRETLYSKEMSRRTYRAMTERALSELREGKSVIMDATFSRQEARKAFIDSMGDVRGNYLFVEVQASKGTIKKRLAERDRKNDVISDARLEDYQSLTSSYEAPKEIEEQHILRVQTDGTVEDSIQQLFHKLADRQIERVD